MRKNQDIMWEQSTLWESVEKWVTKYLIMTFSYGRMLAQLKNEMLNEDSGASTHLIELLTSIRSDELEKQLLDESEEYQNCIKEEENSEAEVKRKLSSKEWKLVDRYVAAVYVWQVLHPMEIK